MWINEDDLLNQLALLEQQRKKKKKTKKKISIIECVISAQYNKTNIVRDREKRRRRKHTPNNSTN